MTTVNLRTRGVAEAAELVEYCKFPSGTALSDRRRLDGSAVPYGVKPWRLGEMDGPWHIGHEPAIAGH
jgi:alpha-L-arabinofuranosidase